ncbi:MAG: sigma 54-dependent Fis family transcriptional regulator [Polyangiaceae bacterium]|nr:sigma 54-dependent Fis family transcriptional regulator [Polyangiaceae bacterium]
MATPRTARSFDDATGTATFARPSDRPLGVVLRVSGAPVAPPLLRLTAGKCVVGSAADCDLVVTDRTVSRRHVELEVVPEGVAVRDLGSRNGTFYLGQRVQSMVLGAGGRVLVGQNATLSIDADSDALHAVPAYEGDEYRGLLGVSRQMRQLFGMLQRLEGSLVSVLVEGESGVGKERVARALHEGSKVALGPFVAVNCGAIARDVVASELFGHKRGAFTGAVEPRRGAFEAASGGTLFLDEIGELPLEVQPMLLRALESGEIRAVGEDTPRFVKVRVIAATNRDLEDGVRQGSFREDLFYRLAVVRLRVPPVRERRDDVDVLAQRFAASEGLGELPKQVRDALRARELPGNVRELRNLVQAYGALGVLPAERGGGRDVRQVALRHSVDLSRPFLEQRDELLEEFTRTYLEALLAHTGGNQTAAAQIAGLDRTYLGRLLGKLRR